jgi:hypothetical protein
MELGVGLYVIPLGMIANPHLIQLETNLPGAINRRQKPRHIGLR